MKAKILNRINAIIALLLSVFGFSSCHPIVKYGAPEPEPVAYGCPYISLDVSGKITNEEKQPLEGIQVNIGLLGYTTRPFYSDSVGKYGYHSHEGIADSVDIIVKDPEGIYESDSVRVATEKNMFETPIKWQEGEATASHDFQLKKK